MKHLKVLIIIAFAAFCFQGSILAKPLNRDTSKTKYIPPVIAKDNPIVAALDSLSVLKCFEKSNFSRENKILNKYNYAPGFVPTFNDSTYIVRIAKLNAKSPFGLVYNDDVKTFIDLYAVKKRQMTCRILGLSEYYFPLFEKYLDKYHIPLELKYLAVVESALNPVAKSSAAANGLWQFIYSTGKMYGLNVTSYIDDRFDPIKSTIAACEHFQDLYAIYKDWSLVLAAYNSGPGNVNKAIRKANGEMDFWKIKKYLPKETQSYVPAFIAVTYVMNYSAEHNLYPVKTNFNNYEIDSVTIKQKLTFDQISEGLNIPIEDVKYLNPCYKEGVIPAFAEEKYTLQLPQKYIGDFITNEASLYVYKTKAMLEEERIFALKQREIQVKDSLLALQRQKINKKSYINTYKTAITNNPKTIISDNELASTYTVKAGDGIGIIAYKYNITIAQLQDWNKMKNANIYPGQKLYVRDPAIVTVKGDSNIAKTDVKTVTPSTNNKTQTVVSNNTQTGKIKYVFYTVQKGDTLWRIASQYKGVSVEEIKKLNNLTNNSMLYIGQKLKVAVSG